MIVFPIVYVWHLDNSYFRDMTRTLQSQSPVWDVSSNFREAAVETIVEAQVSPGGQKRVG